MHGLASDISILALFNLGGGEIIPSGMSADRDAIRLAGKPADTAC